MPVTDDAVKVIEEVVADEGYNSRTTVHDLETLEIRTYISEPNRGRQSWIDQRPERDAVYANRRRIRGARGKRLLRRRGELLERPCAHLYESGGRGCDWRAAQYPVDADIRGGRLDIGSPRIANVIRPPSPPHIACV
jgi:hypothetical protein